MWTVTRRMNPAIDKHMSSLRMRRKPRAKYGNRSQELDAAQGRQFVSESREEALEEETLWRGSSSLKWTIFISTIILLGFSVLGNYWESLVRQREGHPRATFWEVVFDDDFDYENELVYGLVIAAGVTSWAFYKWRRTAHRGAFMVDRATKKIEAEEARLATQDVIPLPQLWAVTQKRLDFYHGIATVQARVSFRYAQAARVAGFLTVILATIFAATAATTTASVVIAVLGGVGAALSAYIGNTFVRTQESAAGHLKSYFLQPLEFSKYLAAERLMRFSSESNRDAIIAPMVLAMLGVTNTNEAIQSSGSEQPALYLEPGRAWVVNGWRPSSSKPDDQGVSRDSS
jgi:hypothetical protein